MFTSTHSVRIEWGHCDPAGIVFFPRYLEIFDACTNLLFERAMGLTKFMFTKKYNLGGWPMVDVRAVFTAPTRYGDDTIIDTAITHVGKSSFRLEHKLSKDGKLSVEGYETRVWVMRDPSDPDKIRSTPIPDDVRTRLMG